MSSKAFCTISKGTCRKEILSKTSPTDTARPSISVNISASLSRMGIPASVNCRTSVPLRNAADLTCP